LIQHKAARDRAAEIMLDVLPRNGLAGLNGSARPSGDRVDMAHDHRCRAAGDRGLTYPMPVVTGSHALWSAVGSPDQRERSRMRRRDFMAGLGSAAACPVVVQAQQPTLPLIGYLGQGTAATDRPKLVALRQGLSEVGYVEGRNVVIEPRFAEGQFDRLPALAADLVRRQVAVIVANGPPPAHAMKAQSNTIPIVFAMGQDPVKEGLVVSFNRPGGNITGYVNLNNQLFGRRMGLR
jgi:hypothetical protein